MHPAVKNLCERAARVVNLDICGVDLILENIGSPVPKEKGGVIELNAAPGLRMHRFPSEGKPRDIGGAIVEWLYPRGREARIPIITVTGTNGKTTVTRMISHILQQTGWHVVMTTTDGIYLNGEEIARGDTTGPISAKTVLGDRLETARGGIVRRGLGYDWSDIAVITNISEDHIGQDGIKTVEDIISIKALVAERVRAGGTLIVNAEDANSLRVLARERVKTPARKIVLFSLDKANERVREHLVKGGTAYLRRGDTVVEAKGKSLYTLANVNSIRATMNGAAEFQIANALAAIAAARSRSFGEKHFASRNFCGRREQSGQKQSIQSRARLRPD